MYIISGRGRKSGVARATGATASLAPMEIQLEVDNNHHHHHDRIVMFLISESFNVIV